MTSQTPDMQAVLKRLEKLEKQNRRLRRAGAAALMGICAIVLMGQAAPKSRTVEAGEAKRDIIWVGVDLKLGMAEDEVIKKIAEAGYEARKAPSVPEQLRKRGVTSLWIVQTRQADSKGNYIGAIEFSAGKVSSATREWVSFSGGEGVEFARNLYFLLRGFEEERNIICRVETSAAEVPDFATKHVSLKCGRKTVRIFLDKFRDQVVVVHLNEDLADR